MRLREAFNPITARIMNAGWLFIPLVLLSQIAGMAIMGLVFWFFP